MLVKIFRRSFFKSLEVVFLFCAVCKELQLEHNIDK